MYQHQQLIQKAKALGVEVKDISTLMGAPFAILTYGGVEELIRDGVPTSLINLRNQFFCDNKQLTKLAYEALDIPYPSSLLFHTAEEPALSDFIQEGQRYVCKPLDGTNGVGVVTGIQTLEMVKRYFRDHGELADRFMIEEEVEGEDLRIQVIGGRLVAACIREPAFVMGNGQDDLQTLIEARRAVMRTQNPNNFLEIDEATRTLLDQQQLQLTDIPAEGRKVRLKFVSNMAQGGVATDVSQEIHPLYHQWVTDLTNYLKTGYFGLDLMTTDYTASPTTHSKVLEINARADWLHHTFSERRTHDIAGMILKEVFGI